MLDLSEDIIRKGITLHLIIDGLIFQLQKVGGVSRIFTEILPRMCEFDNSLEISIITTKTLQQPLPAHKNIRQHKLFPIDNYLKPAWLWRELDLRSKFIKWNIGKGSKAIWHSTYFTRINGWKGKEVVTVHDLIYELYPEYYKKFKDERMRAIRQECILSADAVICVSHSTQKDVVEFYNLDIKKTHVVPNAYNPIFKQRYEYQSSTIRPKNKPFLLYVGVREIYKNFTTILQGYSLWKYRNEVDIVVVGKDWSVEEKRNLDKLNLLNSVHLISNISDDYLVELYNCALAFVFPSLYEGFGIPLLEAMACGCPIVASRIPTSIEVAGEVPFYFDPTDIDSLLSALDDVYQQDNVSQKVSAGLEHIKKYSWDKTAQETIAVYQNLMRI